MVSFTGLLLSVVTSLSIFLILILAFLYFSRSKNNDVIYFPARLAKGLDPPPKSIFSGVWLWEALFTKDEEIANFAGLDAAVYVRFLSTALSISFAAAVFGLIVLVPVCATDHHYADFNARQEDPAQRLSYDTFDTLGMGNVSKTSNRVWAFVAGAWWMTAWTFFLLYQANETLTTMLASHYGSAKALPEQYTVLVRDIPRPPVGQTRQEQVDTFFRQMYPASYSKSVVVLKLAQVLKVWNELKSCEWKKSQAEAVALVKGKSLMRQGGIFGLGGRNVDAVQYYEHRIHTLRPVLEKEQMKALEGNTSAAAFVFFQTRAAATKASQVIHARRTDTWVTSPGPDPNSIRWGDVALSHYERAVRRVFAVSAVSLVVVFFLIPVGIVSALATLSTLEDMFTFLVPILEWPLIKSSLEAYLPQLVLYGSIAAVPYGILWLSTVEGYPSEVEVWNSTLNKVYSFLVFNVFIGLTISGTLASFLQKIPQTPWQEILELLGTSVPNNATFFITYVALIFYVSYGLEISRLIPLITFKLRSRYFITEKEKREAWAPTSVAYYLKVPQDLLILTLGLCYAIIAPMILAFTAIYFSFALLIYRHQVLNVYAQKWDGGGKMWPHIHSRIVAALFTAQITLIAYFGINESLTTFCLLPLPLATSIYAWASTSRFNKSFSHAPLEVVREPVEEGPSPAKLVLAYTPRCMQAPSVYEALGDLEAADLAVQVNRVADEDHLSTPLLHN